MIHPSLNTLLAAAISVVALVGAGCSSQAQNPAPPPPLVKVSEISVADVPLYAEYPAQTYARNMVEVRGRVEGYIDKWLFKPGSQVTAGQALYVLDLRPYRAALEQAQGNLRQSEADLEFARQQVSLRTAEANLAATQAGLVKAQQDYERLKPLVEQDAAAKQDLDAATASLRAGEANLNAGRANVEQTALSTRTQIKSNEGKVEALRGAVRTAELNLQYGTITAPISGLVGDTLVPVGGLVTPASAQPLTTIVPLDPIWVRFNVSEAQYLQYLQRLAKPEAALPLQLVLADNTIFPQAGRIENALNQVDPKTGTLELQARFANPQHTLLPGQFGRVRVQTEVRKGAVLVPQRAIQQLQSLRTVLTVSSDNKVESRVITTGQRVGEQWIVEQGLKPGDRVIVEGLMRVRPGMTVRAETAKQTAERR